MSSTNSQPSPERLITLTGVDYIRPHRRVLSDINLTVDRGDFIAITGPNGGGKTTLLRIILGLIAPTSGSVAYTLGGKPVAHLPFGYLPQKNQIDSHFPITVEQVVASGLLGSKGLSEAHHAELIARAISLTGLENLRNRPIGRLSGGQLQRALIARAIVAPTEVLVLDEPLSYIDKHFEAHLYDIIADIAKRSTILLVSHEMSKIASMASRHLIVDRTITRCTATCHYIPTECSD